MAAGTITVNVQAKTAKAVGNLKKFQKSAKKTGKVARSGSAGVAMLGSKLRMLGAAAGGAIAAGFTARTFFAAAAGVQKLNDVSAKLGISVNHLRQLQHAANLTGVSTETLNMALQRQVRRIAEAAMGTGEAAAALKELGLDAKALNRLSPYEQFRLISEAMKGIPNQADKIRVSFKLWDSEGAALVTSLKGGAAGLDRIRRRFQRLGLEFNEIKLAQMGRFTAAMTELSLVSQVTGQQIAISIAPAATKFAEAMLEAIEGFKLISRGWDDMFSQNSWMRKLIPFKRLAPEETLQGKVANWLAFQEDKSYRAFDDMLTDSLFGKGTAKRTQDFALEMDSWVSSIYNMRRVTPDELRRTREARGGRRIGARWAHTLPNIQQGLPPAGINDRQMSTDTMTARNQMLMARRTIRALESIDERTREQNEDLRRAKKTVVRLGAIP